MAYAVIATVAVGEMLLGGGYWEAHKDNSDFFATHNHDGSLGSGSAALDLTTTLFTDQSDQDAPAAGKTIVWTGSGVTKQRTNGGVVETLSVVGHSH